MSSALNPDTKSSLLEIPHADFNSDLLKSGILTTLKTNASATFD